LGRLSNGYKESKEKLLNIIKEKEDDLEEIKGNHKYEEEYLFINEIFKKINYSGS